MQYLYVYNTDEFVEELGKLSCVISLSNKTISSTVNTFISVLFQFYFYNADSWKGLPKKLSTQRNETKTKQFRNSF